MHVDSRGDGRPIVILHGWRLDGTVEQADLEPVFAHNPGWTRHYVDLPGMGQSKPLGPDANLATYVDVLRSLIRELIGNEAFALAGTSAGALIALNVAGFTEHKVVALLLRMPLVQPDRDKRDVPTGDAALLTPELAALRALKVDGLWAPAEGRVNKAVIELRADPRRYQLDLPTNILTVPALVIAGRQDTRAGWRDAVQMLERLPRATFAVIDGAEHEYPWARSQLFDDLVTDWLSRAAAAFPPQRTMTSPVEPISDPPNLQTWYYEQNLAIANIFFDWRHKLLALGLGSASALATATAALVHESTQSGHFRARIVLAAPAFLGFCIAIAVALVNARFGRILRATYDVGYKLEQRIADQLDLPADKRGAFQVLKQRNGSEPTPPTLFGRSITFTRVISGLAQLIAVACGATVVITLFTH